jgi:hypothetical protein
VPATAKKMPAFAGMTAKCGRPSAGGQVRAAKCGRPSARVTVSLDTSVSTRAGIRAPNGHRRREAELGVQYRASLEFRLPWVFRVHRIPDIGCSPPHGLAQVGVSRRSRRRTRSFDAGPPGHAPCLLPVGNVTENVGTVVEKFLVFSDRNRKSFFLNKEPKISFPSKSGTWFTQCRPGSLYVILRLSSARTIGATLVPKSSIARMTCACGIGPTLSCSRNR